MNDQDRAWLGAMARTSLIARVLVAYIYGQEEALKAADDLADLAAMLPEKERMPAVRQRIAEAASSYHSIRGTGEFE